MPSDWRERRRKSRILRAVKFSVAAVVIAVAAVLIYCVPPSDFVPKTEVAAREEGELRLHFLNVGQGDGCIVEFPDGACLMIDAGDGDFSNTNTVLGYLKGLAPTSLTLLATHGDIDHYGGLAAVYDSFGAEKMYLPPKGGTKPAYEELVERAEKCGFEFLKEGTVLKNEASGAYLVCISVLPEGDDNNGSAVLYLSYKNFRALFSADIGESRERALAARYRADSSAFGEEGFPVCLDGIDLLKVAHHGSATSSSEAWVNLLRPKTAVISSGRGNRYAHPASEAVSRLEEAEIYRTDELGNIVVSVREGTFSVQTETE